MLTLVLSLNAPSRSIVQALEVRLTATNALGASAMTSLLLQPVRGAVTLDTMPSGQGMLVNGQPTATPAIFTTVAGFVIELAPPTGRAATAWSDGAAAAAGARSYTVPLETKGVRLTLTLGGAVPRKLHGRRLQQEQVLVFPVPEEEDADDGGGSFEKGRL